MSSNDFLAKLGLYFRPNFLDRRTCEALCRLMASAPASPAEVYVEDPSANAINLRARRALSVDPPPDEVAAIERTLDDVRDDLARHFHVGLTTRELTDYLAYGPGAFFRPHRDRPNASSQVGVEIQRQVSVVIFLSEPPSGANPDYEGGELRFYRLLDGPEWSEVGFACDAAPGLLVAFPSDTLHEVTPVSTGQRCAIVTWFCA